MTQSIISVSINISEKTAFDALCNDIGITAYAAINMFIKAVLH